MFPPFTASLFGHPFPLSIDGLPCRQPSSRPVPSPSGSPAQFVGACSSPPLARLLVPRLHPGALFIASPSLHRVVSWVPSCRRCTVYRALTVPILARCTVLVNPFFKSFSLLAHQSASPIFDDRDKEGKCPTRDIMKERPTNNQ